MINNYKNFILGIFIFLIPFFGLPLSFKFFLVSFCGVLLSLFSFSFSKKDNINQALNFYENVSDHLKDFSVLDSVKEVVKKPRKPRVKKVLDIKSDLSEDMEKDLSEKISVLDENNENTNSL